MIHGSVFMHNHPDLSDSVRVTENREQSAKLQTTSWCLVFRRSDLHHSEDVNYLFLVSLADSSHGLCDEGGESPADDDTVHLVSRSW